MPTPADITKPDSIGRKFDPRKFRPFLDRLGRFINLHLGRKPKPAPSPMTTTEPTTLTPAIAADAPPSGSNAAPTATPSAPAAPSFADIDAAARAPDPAPEPAAAAAADDAEALSTANTIIGIIQTALVLIGDDEGVLSETEKTLLRHPLNRVLEKYDIGADVLPPEVDFAFALASIVIARLKKPKTATTFAKFKHWLREKLARRRGEKLAKEVKEATE